MNINYQRSLKKEQFITAKISGNTLKQGSRTHSVLRQRGSQLQKYKAARLSRQTWGDYSTNVIDYDYLPPAPLRLRINKITM